MNLISVREPTGCRAKELYEIHTFSKFESGAWYGISHWWREVLNIRDYLVEVADTNPPCTGNSQNDFVDFRVKKS